MSVRRHPIAFIPGDASRAPIPIDLALVERLRTSFAMLRERGHVLGTTFYARLFDSNPELRPLFTSDLEAQARKLVDALEAVVRNLEAPEANQAMLADLGRRHVAYGARPEHYEVVARLLVESMAEVLGSDIDARTLDEWRQAIDLVSRQMIAGARAADSTDE
ncbi:MAG: hypothetical protein KDA28_13145 [Phycisphaerales bacterium]|nr:hypothetical protein [Phycisphaerales bacterium]